jgi:5-methylcytosine-specific restriction endonuclease McrA
MDNCSRNVKAHGFCSLHWARVKKFGDPNFVSHVAKIDPNQKCAAIDCENKVSSKNLCKRHYNRMLKTGDPNTPLKVVLKKQGDKCIVDGCEELQKTKGYCKTHYSRYRDHGDPTKIVKLHKYEDDAICIVENCNQKPKARNMCSRHWILWRKHGDPTAGAFVQKVRKAVTHPDGTRTCSECEIRQPISNFHKDRSATDGYRSKCKTCRISMVKDWYKDNSERQREKAREFRKENVEKLRKRDKDRYEKDKPKRLELATKHSQIRRSRKRMLPYDERISRGGLRKIFGDSCYYCGVEMDFSPASNRKFKKNHATIEHLVALSKGGHHVWENVVLACHSCNVTKNAKSEAEFKKYIHDLKNHSESET